MTFLVGRQGWHTPGLSMLNQLFLPLGVFFLLGGKTIVHVLADSDPGSGKRKI